MLDQLGMPSAPDNRKVSSKAWIKAVWQDVGSSEVAGVGSGPLCHGQKMSAKAAAVMFTFKAGRKLSHFIRKVNASLADFCSYFIGAVGWIVSSQKRCAGVLTRSLSNCDLIWRQYLKRDNQVKVKSLGCVLSQYAWCPCKRGNLDGDRCPQREGNAETEGEGHYRRRRKARNRSI